MSFNQRLRKVCREKNSYLAIGLDPDMDLLPGFLMDFESPILEFNKSIINATSDLVCAYKLNTAFYEIYGVQGWRVLRKTLELIPEDTLAIIDGKRGDVGHSSEKYARALFGDLAADAATVNPYLGRDALEPFIRDPNKGAFVLCLTSNPGAKDFQYRPIEGEPLFIHVARKAREWNVNQNIGLVVGATYAEEIHRVREQAPDLPFLIPGVGAQGGDLHQAVRGAADEQGEGFLISVSRGILYVADDVEFAQASRKAAKKYRDQINEIRTNKS